MPSLADEFSDLSLQICFIRVKLTCFREFDLVSCIIQPFRNLAHPLRLSCFLVFSHSKTFFEESSTKIGGKYTKAVFRQYTDIRYIQPANRPTDEEHLGLLGPALKAEVGDALLVTVRNRVRYPISLLAHGLSYSFQEESTGKL